MKAVFLDRDGTINFEVPNYLTDINKLEVLEPAYEAIQLLNQHQFKTFVATNQACVGKGMLDETALKRIHNRLLEKLSEKKAFIDSVYYCPHHPDDRCFCRKPNTGMIQQAVKEHGIDPKKSFFVGDRLFDIHSGHNAGCKTVLVLTGAGKETLAALGVHHQKPTHIADNILEAVRWIITQPHSE